MDIGIKLKKVIATLNFIQIQYFSIVKSGRSLDFSVSFLYQAKNEKKFV